MSGKPGTKADGVTIRRGEVERVQEEPVGFRVIRGYRPRDDVVVPIYALGRRVYETWIEDGQKWGRWHWEYV